jgi:hypothetical protein
MVKEKKDSLKHKLGYEWKNIFRALSLLDSQKSGQINRKQFETTVHKNGVFLAGEDVRYLMS